MARTTRHVRLALRAALVLVARPALVGSALALVAPALAEAAPGVVPPAARACVEAASASE